MPATKKRTTKERKPAKTPALRSTGRVPQNDTYVPTGRGGSFVLVSDLHVHPWAAFGKGSGRQNTRLRRTMELLETTLRAASEEGVPWVFAGDLVQTAGYVLNEVMAELTTIFHRYPDVQKLAIWGNHDARGIGGQITCEQTALEALRQSVANFTVMDPSLNDGMVVEAGGLTFSGAGYQPNADALTLGRPADVGLYHQTVRGTHAPSGVELKEGVDPMELMARHRVVIVGHVHHWQYGPVRTQPAGRLILIPGSPEQHNFGDKGEHGWWRVTVPPGERDEVEHERVPGGSPEFRTVSSPKQIKSDGHFYRVERMGAGEVLPAGAAVIAPSPTAIASRDVLRGARGEAAVAAWLQHEPPEAVKPAMLRKYLEAGKLFLPAQTEVTLRPFVVSSISLHNFCSYEKAELTVRPGTRLVLGQGRDFPSNGAGKSTLFEAVYWALFGQTTKGLTGDEVIRWGTDDCMVRVVLTDPRTADDPLTTEWVTVTRRRGKKAGLYVEGAGKDGAWVMEAASINEMTDRLRAYLGITPTLYQALGYFSQERLFLFASASDAERKEMLAHLIGLDAYQEASVTAGRQAAQCGAEVQQAEAAVQAVQQSTARERERIAVLEQQHAAWESDNTRRQAQATAALATFKAAAVARHAEWKAEAITRFSGKTAERRTSLEQKLSEMSEQLFLMPDQPPPENAVEKRQAALREAQQGVITVTATRETTQRQVDTLTKKIAAQQQQLRAGTCPGCGQAVTKAHVDRCLHSLQQELQDYKDALDRATEELTTWLQTRTENEREFRGATVAQQAWQRREQHVAAMERVENDLAVLKEDAAVMDAQAKTYADGEVRKELQRLTAEVHRVQQEVNPHTSGYNTSEARLKELLTQEGTLTKAQSAAAQRQAIAAYWQRGFSKQGLQSLLVDEVAALFNEARGTIFPALTQGVYDVQFSTVSQTKGGEWRERTEFQVYAHGEPVPYSALSGGQRRRIDVGVMLTLVSAVSRWLQVPGVLGMLVLDEVFGFLDSSGSEGLLEALREVQAQVPAIYVVSHDAQLQALFPEAVLVQQDANGVSSVSTTEAM